MKISIHVEMPKPGSSEPYDRHKSVEEEVKHCIDMIESGHDSIIEWKTINRLAAELRGKKSPRARDILKMIDPVLAKYGIHGDHARNDEA